MAEEQMNHLRDQLLAVAERIKQFAETISAPEAPKDDDVTIVPETFLCPVTDFLMIDPVILYNGHTVGRFGNENSLRFIQSWPNDIARALMRDWCKVNNKSDLIQYSESTSFYIRKEYFESLHKKLSSPVQKEAAKELRKEVTEKSYFRKLYAEIPEGITQLLGPLSKSERNSEIHPQVQEDLITTLMIISAYEEVKKVIAETPETIGVLVDALRAENVETRRNAVSTFFHLSSMDSNKEILGIREAIVEMATLLIEEAGALFIIDVATALFWILENDKNKEIAISNRCVLASLFQKIEENECVDIMLQILANLSTIKEGVNEMDKFDCSYLLRVIRESLSDEDKETVTAIISNVLNKKYSKWIDSVRNEEISRATLSDIFEKGTLRAKEKAEEVLDMLKLEM